jgi:2,4-dienoyl-CoA reductase-like NADH-dependent reductase (Old Yellow Enzyme family)
LTSLFDTTTIKNMTLANRFVYSATNLRQADQDGAVTPELVNFVEKPARGGIGLFISGFAYVLKSGQGSPGQLGIYDDALIPGLRKMVNGVQQHGSKIVAQIVHCGAHSNPDFIGETPMAPSVMETADGPICRAMTQKDIDEVVDAFEAAAVRTKQAGFDGVQLHGAHGYLFSEFISPFYNKRTDQYGGSVESRAKIVVDTYHKVRDVVGEDYPVMIKMNVTDFLDGGLTTEDALKTASILDKAGIDSIELSGGTGWGMRVLGDVNRTAMRTVQEEAYYQNVAQRMKKTVMAPIILTGGIRSYEVADHLVKNGVADYIGLCRPLIREPDLVNRWKSGDTRKSGCISDNACSRSTERPLRCVHVKSQAN